MLNGDAPVGTATRQAVDKAIATLGYVPTPSMWYHGAGNEVESKIINQIITDFNASQADWKVELQSFPQGA